MKTQHYIRFISGLAMLLMFSTTGMAQKNLTKAKEAMDRFAYTEAIGYFEKYFVLHPPSSGNLRDISYCHLMMNNQKEAAKWLKRLSVKRDATAYDILIYARTLHSLGEYAEAIEHYQRYGVMKPEDKNTADAMISACNQAIEWIENPEHYEVENLMAVNSENSDFGLIAYEDHYVFTSDRRNKPMYTDKEVHGWTGNPYYKLYKTDQSKPNTGEILAQINGDFHTGPAVYDTDNKAMFFTRTRIVKQKQRPTNPDPTSWMNPPSNDLYTNRLEIYIAHDENGNWSQAKPFEHNRAEEYSVGHPTLSPNGKILYFVSDMPGGYGETDIYYSHKQADGSWSKPANAGSNINTSGKEMFPHIDNEGTLYFSSDGHAGMGGLDIFKASGSENNWSVAENLRFPINSSGDDFSIYFTEAGKQAYFSSNREGGKGSDDIYRLTWSPPTQLVLAVKTLENFDGMLTPLPYVNLDITANSDGSVTTTKTNQESVVYLQADCNKTYTVKAQRENHFSQTAMVSTECTTKSDTIWVEVVLERIVINKAIVLKNIYYDFDKWNIRPDAAIELDKLVNILKENPEIIIELGSHTDSRGSKQYNETLSQRRAESAVAYIISMGIEAERITAKGYGESVPVNECVDGVNCSEEAHQMNRRTEFKVTGYRHGLVSTE